MRVCVCVCVHVRVSLSAPFTPHTGIPYSLDCGDWLYLTGPLTVCGRSDGDPTRGFRGAVAMYANDVKVRGCVYCLVCVAWHAV